MQAYPYYTRRLLSLLCGVNHNNGGLRTLTRMSVFFFNFAIIIIGLCAKSEAKSENGEWFFLLKRKKKETSVFMIVFRLGSVESWIVKLKTFFMSVNFLCAKFYFRENFQATRKQICTGELKQRRRRRRRRRLVKNEFIFYERDSRLPRSARYANGSKDILKLNM